MRSNELRIGNLIEIMPEQKGIIRQIIELKERELSIYMIEDKMVLPLPYAGVIPVKLSMDIIEKLGFELFDYDLFDDEEVCDEKETCLVFKINHPIFKRCQIGIDLFVENAYCQVYLIQGSRKKNEYTLYHQFIQYVHELQNLYFALTGEELQLKNQGL